MPLAGLGILATGSCKRPPPRSDGIEGKRMRPIFVTVCILWACIARADVYYDFETAATSPVWIGTTQMIQNASASYDGTNAIAFTGESYGGTNAAADILIELPQNTTNVGFYFYDDYGPNPPLYQYMHFYLLQDTDSTGFAGFSMLDGGWGTTPPKTENHYYAWGQEEYNAGNMGPIRTVGWHKFTFAVGAESVAMSVDGTLVFQTNMIQTARYLGVSLVTTGWGRMDDLYISTGTYDATATATLVNDFVVAANITDGGYGYTNTPLVRFIGGGGNGAEAVAVVSNGLVIAVNVLDAGYGYTNAPLVVIEPPFIPNPMLSIAPMSFLAFSNLTLGGVYQLQQSVAWYWSNQPVSFTATNVLYTQMIAGVVGSGDYRLALNPVPRQAFATPQVVDGFVVSATVTSGGSGYVANPAVSIVGGGGSNATAVSQISGGVVTNITITDAGIGYTNTPTVEVAQPPAATVSPTVLPVMRLDSASLAPYDNYQIQFKPDLGTAWGNWNGGLFSPTDVTNSQYVFITNDVGFFRLQYVP
jgi:hypothetical protein